MCIQSYKQIKAMNLSTYKKKNTCSKTGSDLKIGCILQPLVSPTRIKTKDSTTILVVWCIQPSYAVFHGVPTGRQVCSWPLLEACAATIIAAVWPSEKAMQLHLGQYVADDVIVTLHNCHPKIPEVKRNRKKVL